MEFQLLLLTFRKFFRYHECSRFIGNESSASKFMLGIAGSSVAAKIIIVTYYECKNPGFRSMIQKTMTTTEKLWKRKVTML